jgi:aspartate 1-decarboxylase
MTITVLKSKIHSIEVSQARHEYNGSITISPEHMRDANLYEYEQVHVHNSNNGERILTYVLRGEKGQKGVFINGAASHKFNVGDKVHILSYTTMVRYSSKQYNHKPIII